MIVHGDDFIFVGRSEGRAKTVKLLSDNFEIKTGAAGPIDGMARELKVLGRVAVCHPWGWSLETNPSLIEMAVGRLGLSQSKGVSSPGAKPEGGRCSADFPQRRVSPKPLNDPSAHWPGEDLSPPFKP